MAITRTDKSKYPSRYSPKGWVTAAQYIIELVCERKAQFDNKDLPVKFWHLPEWEKYYKSQLRATHRLLKSYSEKAIIKVVKGSRIRTLLPKWIEPIIAEEHRILELRKSQITTEQEPVEEPIIVKRPRPNRLGKGLDDLLALDEKNSYAQKEKSRKED